jgi:hypothetical protein
MRVPGAQSQSRSHSSPSWDGLFRDDVLRGFNQAQVGDPMSRVLRGFQYSSPLFLVPHGDYDCDDANCWIAVTYEGSDPNRRTLDHTQIQRAAGAYPEVRYPLSLP